jgi:hypothetical protein
MIAIPAALYSSTQRRLASESTAADFILCNRKPPVTNRRLSDARRTRSGLRTMNGKQSIQAPDGGATTRGLD